MRRTGTALVALAALMTVMVPEASPGVATTRAAEPVSRAAATVPVLHVSHQVSGLSIPWDVQNLPGGRLLIDERTDRKLLVYSGGTTTTVSFPSSSVWASGETGLMGLAVDPAFASNRRIYTCQGGFTSGGGHDVRVVAWRMNDAYTAVTQQRILVSGFPTSSGRHGGCRLLITRGGALIVGTGDAATGTNPQNLRSLGGKTLRLNRISGAPWPSNPWPHAASKARRYVYTYGHRNVQGLSQRADGTLWSVEQGTYRDDEVNRLVRGGNYGYNPVPGYNESVPMTNFKLPGRQYGAKWRSGTSTLATSGATWVRGRQWGVLNGTLAVASLKANRLTFLKFDKNGKLMSVRNPAALRTSGRLRSVTVAPNGDLLITTSNSTDQSPDADVVLRVHPTL